jgi:hypothetical protein
MVALYVRRIKDGLMTVEDVPSLWRDKVRKALEDESAETIES